MYSKSKPIAIETRTRVVTLLDKHERRMLDELMAADDRSQSGTLRYALRILHAQRFPTPPTN